VYSREVEQVLGQHPDGYEKPRHVAFVEALPRNSLGKVLKAELRKRGVT